MKPRRQQDGDDIIDNFIVINVWIDNKELRLSSTVLVYEISCANDSGYYLCLRWQCRFREAVKTTLFWAMCSASLTLLEPSLCTITDEALICLKD